MNITMVPHGAIHKIVPHITGYVAKASEWTLGRMGADDIIASMFQKDVLTWIVFDEDKVIHGYLTTQIQTYPQAKHFAVLNCGGAEGSLEACIDLVFDTFEQYAQEVGCDGIEIIGRAAWWHHIKDRGYTQPQRQFFKALGE